MDMVNQGLLLVGIHRSLKQPNTEHPYGYHKEQYAWAIISASGILFVGGGIPIYSGISSFLNPSVTLDLEHLKVAYAVLGTALFFEGCK
jgi:zinc transporter 9